ncbi:MAG: hypothetical protein RLY16_2852 [Bacteroidota bacterium]|jgi:hypothetical protein
MFTFQQQSWLPTAAIILLAGCQSSNQTNSTSRNPQQKVLPPVENASLTVQQFITQAANDYEQAVQQHYMVRHKKPTVIIGKKGVRITIDPAALETLNGNDVSGDINVSIVELNNQEDFLRCNAATVSDGKLLVSGGSYYIGMQSNGQELRIKKGKHLKVEFPKIQKEEMALFIGERTSQGDMNWKFTTEPLMNTQSDAANIEADAMKVPYPIINDAKLNYCGEIFFNSTSTKVNFEDKTVPLYQMAATLQQRGIDKYIDTMPYFIKKTVKTGNPNKPESTYMEPHFEYRFISRAQKQIELAAVDSAKARQKFWHDANLKYMEAWKNQSDKLNTAGQIKLYYAPTSITNLGWINCDRFYRNTTPCETPLEMPLALNKNQKIDYYIIFHQINSLFKGQLLPDVAGNYVISNLPKDHPVTVIAFIQQNDQLMSASQRCILGNGTVKLNFKPISKDEIAQAFSKRNYAKS